MLNWDLKIEGTDDMQFMHGLTEGEYAVSEEIVNQALENDDATLYDDSQQMHERTLKLYDRVLKKALGSTSLLADGSLDAYQRRLIDHIVNTSFANISRAFMAEMVFLYPKSPDDAIPVLLREIEVRMNIIIEKLLMEDALASLFIGIMMITTKDYTSAATGNIKNVLVPAYIEYLLKPIPDAVIKEYIALASKQETKDFPVPREKIVQLERSRFHTEVSRMTEWYEINVFRLKKDDDEYFSKLVTALTQTFNSLELDVQENILESMPGNLLEFKDENKWILKICEAIRVKLRKSYQVIA